MIKICYCYKKPLYLPHLIYDFEVLTKSPEVGSILHQPLFIIYSLCVSNKFTTFVNRKHKRNINIYNMMKSINIKSIIILLSLIFVISSCEKAEDDDDNTTKTERPDTGNNNGNDGSDNDNSGSGDENEGNNNGGFKAGDVIDVVTFCNNDLRYVQLWVRGYIVGAATGVNKKIRYDFEPPFSYDTAILISDSPNYKEGDYLMSVNLPSGTKKRTELNLKDNEGNLGKLIEVLGLQKTYLKLPGFNPLDNYRFP